MAKILLINAFSLNMLAEEALPAAIAVIPVTRERAREVAAEGFTSSVGHADTAAVLGDELGMEVPMNRSTVSLGKGHTILVGQYTGPRLPEGAHKLPEGASIKWRLVTVG